MQQSSFKGIKKWTPQLSVLNWYDYIRTADEKKIYAIYNLLEDEIEGQRAWWQNRQLVNELDARYEALESGKDQGFTLSQIEEFFEKLRKKKYDGYSL